MKETIERLGEHMKRYEQVKLRKGRGVSAFKRADGGCYELARGAYQWRFTHCKLLAALDQGEDEAGDLLGQVANASARRILWIFMHRCLADYPGKEAAYRELRGHNNAHKLIQGIEALIVGRLDAGTEGDAEFAARVRDDSRFFAFAEEWLSRPKGNRIKNRRRPDSMVTAD
jgi:hypothetical protein